MTATNPSALSLSLSLSDLNVTINHEPRLHDIRVAERLGFERPRAIRQLIERNRCELETYGSLAPQRVALKTGKGRALEVDEYWLNEPQTLLICMFSKTANAAAVRREVIDVYMAYRRGLAAPAKPDTSATRELSEKRRLVAECRKVMGPRAAQAMWKDLGLPGNAPDQNELALAAIPAGQLSSDGRYLIVVHGRVVTEVRDLAGHCAVDGRSAANVFTFLREFLATDLLPGALDIILHRLNASAARAKAGGTP